MTSVVDKITENKLRWLPVAVLGLKFDTENISVYAKNIYWKSRKGN